MESNTSTPESKIFIRQKHSKNNRRYRLINSNRKDSSKLQLDIFPKALNESERKIDSSETAKSRKAIYSKVHNSQEFSNWKFLALNNMFDNCDIKERRVSQVALGINTNDDFADSPNRLTGRK